MLNNIVKETLIVFKSHEISEDDQRKLMSNGLHFNFTYGDPDPTGRNTNLDFIQVGKLLKICDVVGLDINVDEMLKQPYSFKHESLVKFVSTL